MPDSRGASSDQPLIHVQLLLCAGPGATQGDRVNRAEELTAQGEGAMDQVAAVVSQRSGAR